MKHWGKPRLAASPVVLVSDQANPIGTSLQKAAICERVRCLQWGLRWKWTA